MSYKVGKLSLVLRAHVKVEGENDSQRCPLTSICIPDDDGGGGDIFLRFKVFGIFEQVLYR